MIRIRIKDKEYTYDEIEREENERDMKTYFTCFKTRNGQPVERAMVIEIDREHFEEE